MILTACPKSYVKSRRGSSEPFANPRHDAATCRMNFDDPDAEELRVDVGRVVLSLKHLSLHHIQQSSQSLHVRVPQAYSHPLSSLKGVWYGLTLPHSIQMLLDVLDVQPQALHRCLGLSPTGKAGHYGSGRHHSTQGPAPPGHSVPYAIAMEGLSLTEKVLLLSVLSRRCIELNHDLEAASMQSGFVSSMSDIDGVPGGINVAVTLQEVNERDEPTGTVCSLCPSLACH